MSSTDLLNTHRSTDKPPQFKQVGSLFSFANAQAVAATSRKDSTAKNGYPSTLGLLGSNLLAKSQATVG